MDELMSMNLGADDFITKPYNTQILVARIASILRRSQKTLGAQNTITYEGLTVCLSDSTAEYKGVKIELTKNEIRILYTLLQNKGVIVTRDRLMEMLWQSNEFIDDNTLTVNMSRIRKKLKEVGLEHAIETKKGLGYLFL